LSDLRIVWNLIKLRRNIWLDTDRLAKIQEKKLRMLVKHAYENVEYYHRAFDAAGLKPGDIKRTEDLTKIPVITKEIVRQNFPAGITSRNIDLSRCTKYTTSGSTGIPQEVLVDPKASDYRAALFARPFFENGLKLRDKMARIVGNPRQERWIEKFGILRNMIVNPNEDVKSALILLSKYKPDAIFGLSSYIYLLAREKEAMQYNTFEPRLIFTTAEVISQARKCYLAEKFGSTIFDLYGSVEVERMAWECEEHVGYHMDIDSNLIEVVDENFEQVSNHENGRIVVTCLYNFAMPVIRYNIGDVAIQTDERCPCGRKLPLLKEIMGRDNDFIILPDGRMIPPIRLQAAVTKVAFKDPRVLQLKIIQENLQQFTILLSLLPDQGRPSNKFLEEMYERAKEVLGKDVSVEISIVDQIDRDKSGKLRAVISKVRRSKS
jgi:phenylacetate-CoA ligase